MNTATASAARRRRLTIAAIPFLCVAALAVGMLIGTVIALAFGFA